MLTSPMIRATAPILLLISYSIQNTYAETIIYKSVDETGNTVLSNKKSQGATALTLPPINVYAAPMSKSDLHAPGYTAKQHYKMDNEHFYSNRSTTNNAYAYNSNSRQQILQEELSQEQAALIDSAAVLNQAKQIKYPSEAHKQKSYDERIDLLQQSVEAHKYNIKLLTQELQ